MIDFFQKQDISAQIYKNNWFLMKNTILQIGQKLLFRAIKLYPRKYIYSKKYLYI